MKYSILSAIFICCFLFEGRTQNQKKQNKALTNTEFQLVIKRDSLMTVQDSVYNEFLIQRGHFYWLCDYSAQLNTRSVHTRTEYEDLANEIRRQEIPYETPVNPYPRLTSDTLWIFAKSVSIGSPITFSIDVSAAYPYLTSLITTVKSEEELSIQIQQHGKNIEKLNSDILGTEASIAALTGFLTSFPSYIKYYNLGIKYHKNIIYNQEANYQAMVNALEKANEKKLSLENVSFEGDRNGKDHGPSFDNGIKKSSIMEDAPVATDDFYLNYKENKKNQGYRDEWMLSGNIVFTDSAFILNDFIQEYSSESVLAELNILGEFELLFVINQAGYIHTVELDKSGSCTYECLAEINRIASLIPGLTPPIRNDKKVNVSISRKVSMK